MGAVPPGPAAARVWWAHWDSFADGRIVQEREVSLDGDYSVQVRYQAPDDVMPPMDS
jgi:hypothetical protein